MKPPTDEEQDDSKPGMGKRTVKMLLDKQEAAFKAGAAAAQAPASERKEASRAMMVVVLMLVVGVLALAGVGAAAHFGAFSVSAQPAGGKP